MWKKFKELNLLLKIIIGFIAIIFLPVTLLLLSVELLIKSFKSKKKIMSLVSILLVLFMGFIDYCFVDAFRLASDPEYIARLETEEQAKLEQEQKKKEETEQKAKEEQTQKKRKMPNKRLKRSKLRKKKKKNKKQNRNKKKRKIKRRNKRLKKK